MWLSCVSALSGLGCLHRETSCLKESQRCQTHRETRRRGNVTNIHRLYWTQTVSTHGSFIWTEVLQQFGSMQWPHSWRSTLVMKRKTALRQLLCWCCVSVEGVKPQTDRKVVKPVVFMSGMQTWGGMQTVMVNTQKYELRVTAELQSCDDQTSDYQHWESSVIIFSVETEIMNTHRYMLCLCLCDAAGASVCSVWSTKRTTCPAGR